MARTPSNSDGDVGLLAAAIDKAGAEDRGRRSPLYRWLRKHHDEFDAFLADRLPTWAAVADGLASLGIALVDGTGKAPEAERVRKTWYHVRKDKEAAQVKRRGKGKPVQASGEIAPGVQQLAPSAPTTTQPAASKSAPEAGTTEAAPRKKLDIRPAQPLGGTAPVPPSAPASPTAAPAQEAADPDEQVRKLIQQMDARKVSVPRIVE